MKIIKRFFLLKDPEVVREVDQYKWIESERLGVDIGFDAAASAWMDLYSDKWVKSRKTRRSSLFFGWNWSQLFACVRK